MSVSQMQFASSIIWLILSALMATILKSKNDPNTPHHARSKTQCECSRSLSTSRNDRFEMVVK